MLVKTRAIVLRNTNFSETSVICKMYTRDFGLRTYLINGVRKAKAKISMAMLQPLSLLDIEAYEKPNANMQRIKELKCEPLLMSIAQDFRKRGVALFITELLNACILSEDSDQSLYDLLEQQIIALEQGDEVSNFPLLFMMRLGKELGIEPHGDYSDSNPYFDLDSACYVPFSNEHTVNKHVSEILYELKLDQTNRHINIDSKTRRETLNSLVLYYQLHIMKNREMRSLAVLSEVMEAWHTV